MIDFGFDKIALIGAVALIVIGPEKLPRVARTVGALMGKARRYVADVKAEVNRSIELEELQKMKSQFETAVQDVEQTVNREVNDAQQALDQQVKDIGSGLSSTPAFAGYEPPPPEYKRPNKRWRLKRSALPRWYKQRAGLRGHAQSGAARVARFRPVGLNKS
ncbi:MAG: Sec-independent protein translocase subunit TatB [Betaproteobacteria bacterium]|nr:Sec-independent protein translocase subunit TatB [Betaproteobacteria bacterium]